MPSQPSRQESERWDGRDGRTKDNGYKNGLDFIIILVVVNFNSSSLIQIDTSYSILTIELVCLPLVISYTVESPDNYLTVYFAYTGLALTRNQD